MQSLNLHNCDLDHVAGAPEQHLKAGKPQIAFSGRSNVGKSSLINSLFMRKKLARVSSTPGKTITVNYYLADGRVYFVDLPGYGYALRSKEDRQRWSSMTQTYFENNDALTLIVQLIDCKVGITEDDADMLKWMNHFAVPYVIVCTKCDKLNKTELAVCSEKIIRSPLIRQGTETVLYSSEKNTGREALLGIIMKALENRNQ